MYGARLTNAKCFEWDRLRLQKCEGVLGGLRGTKFNKLKVESKNVNAGNHEEFLKKTFMLAGWLAG